MWGGFLRGVFVALALSVSGQTGEDPPVTLGKPAGWSVQSTEAVTLIKIAPDSTLYEKPDPDSKRLATVSAGQYGLLDSQLSWVKIRYGETIGWIDLEAEALPPGQKTTFGKEDAPEQQRAFPSHRDWRVTRDLGPYTLFSEADDPELIEVLLHIAEQHAELYRERFGETVDPVGGQIVMFVEREAYLHFLEQVGISVSVAHGHGMFYSPRTVAIFQGKAAPLQLAATLAHELTHFLNWRLRRLAGGGVTFPWWLEEGTAEDLALSRLDREGRLHAALTGRKNLRYGGTLDRILIGVERELFHGSPPSLSELMAFDHETCCSEADAGFSVLLSALWVRFMLDSQDTGLRESFQTYLAGLTHGENPDLLTSRLGREEPWLEDRFRLWVQQRRQRLRPGVILPK